MTIQRRGMTQPGGVPAEQLPKETFEVIGDPENKEAAVFTGTQRRRPVGFLTHSPLTETVDTAFVSPQFQRKGLGRLMYKAAGEPKHSRVLTEQGHGWAGAVGGQMSTNVPVKREEPLNVEGHLAMLPDFAKWISESPSARRVQ